MRLRIEIISAATAISLRLNKDMPTAEAMASAANNKLYFAMGGVYPTDTEILAECGVIIDPREDKPWPESDDCEGCDRHKAGPHRFGCKARSTTLGNSPAQKGSE